jgi:hypothetical protein
MFARSFDWRTMYAPSVRKGTSSAKAIANVIILGDHTLAAKQFVAGETASKGDTHGS